MQEANITDLQYQPSTKDTYSFKKPFLRLERIIGRFFKSIFALFLLIPVVILIILALNYLNILPLSQNFPNYFFDLPHKEFANQGQKNVNLLSDVRFYSNDTNSWFISAHFYKKLNNTVYFYYKDTLITFKIDKNTSCAVIDKDTITNDNSSDIQSTDCNAIFNKNNQNKTFNIEYQYDKTNNFTILSTQLD